MPGLGFDLALPLRSGRVANERLRIFTAGTTAILSSSAPMADVPIPSNTGCR